MKKSVSIRALLGSVLLSSLSIQTVFAYPINVSPRTDGGEAKIEAKLDADNIGMLKIPRGSVKVNGEKITVGAIPEWLFDRHVVLKGTILRTEIEGAGASTRIRGLAYFESGEWLNNLDNIRRKDNLVLDSGAVLVGKLRGINAETLDFQLVTGQLKRIKKSSMAKLISPRAYFFSIPAQAVKIDSNTGEITGEATAIAFNPTVSKKKQHWFAKRTPREPKSFLAGTEGGVSKAQLSGMIFMDIASTVAPLVIAPIVASPLGTKSADRQLNEFDQFERIQANQGILIIP